MCAAACVHYLRARLTPSPKSPEELAESLACKTERSVELRKMHLDSVKMRAERESQRAREAVARKLRTARLAKERDEWRMKKAEENITALEDKRIQKKEALDEKKEMARKARDAMESARILRKEREEAKAEEARAKRAKRLKRMTDAAVRRPERQ